VNVRYIFKVNKYDECNRFIEILILKRRKMCKQLFKTAEEEISKCAETQKNIPKEHGRGVIYCQ
jgi:hypothetical protein